MSFSVFKQYPPYKFILAGCDYLLLLAAWLAAVNTRFYYVSTAELLSRQFVWTQAALGVPTATIFTGRAAAIDEYLCSEGRMSKIESSKDIDLIKLEKKQNLNLRGRIDVRAKVVDIILEQ